MWIVSAYFVYLGWVYSLQMFDRYGDNVAGGSLFNPELTATEMLGLSDIK